MKERVLTPEIIRVQFAPDGRGAVCTLADRRQLPCPRHAGGSDILLSLATGKSRAFARVIGRVVESVTAHPMIERTWEESDYVAAEQMAAQGRLFERTHSAKCGKPQGASGRDCDCAGCSDSWDAWSACRDTERRNQMMETDRSARERSRFAGRSEAEIIATLRAEAHREYDDSRGQRLPHQFLMAAAVKALAAGLPVQSLIDECEAEETHWREQCHAAGIRAAAEAAQIEARRAPHRAAAVAAIASARREINGATASHWQLVSEDSIAEAIADGKEATAEIRALVALRARQEGADSPDTFGYAHGTDFDGGEW